MFLSYPVESLEIVNYLECLSVMLSCDHVHNMLCTLRRKLKIEIEKRMNWRNRGYCIGTPHSTCFRIIEFCSRVRKMRNTYLLRNIAFLFSRLKLPWNVLNLVTQTCSYFDTWCKENDWWKSKYTSSVFASRYVTYWNVMCKDHL
jgi:hypothetical protein